MFVAWLPGLVLGAVGEGLSSQPCLLLWLALGLGVSRDPRSCSPATLEGFNLFCAAFPSKRAGFSLVPC